MQNNLFLSEMAQLSADCSSSIKKSLSLLNISFFHYCTINGSGRRSSLSTHPEWIEYFYQSELINRAYFHQHPSKYSANTKIWKFIEEDYRFVKARDIFNVTNNGFTIIKKANDTCHFYHFASESSPDITYILFEYRELIERFILFFHDKFSTVLSDAQKKGIQCEFSENSADDLKKTDTKISEDKLRAFISLTKVDKFYVFRQDPTAYLTARELSIFQQAFKGLTTKQIAKQFNISYRTVENHIANVKNKIDCHKLTEVFQFLLSAGVIN